jgi:hypothetical protein
MHRDQTTLENAAHRSLTRTLLSMFLGPIVWALHLTVIYGSHAILCARGSSGMTGANVVIVATIIALVPLVISFWLNRTHPNREPEPRFQRQVMQLLTLLSAVGILMAGATIAFVPVCLAVR